MTSGRPTGPASGPALPEVAWVAALAALPGMGPATLHRLLGGGPPEAVWAAVCSGAVVRPAARRARGGSPPVDWSAGATRTDVAAQWARWQTAGIGLLWSGDPRWPASLAGDPEPPGALWWRGDPEALEGPAVAIVGTRRATPEGRRIAATMAADLVSAGVVVVSGLALGIDGAAHRGALRARPGGVDPGRSGGDVARPATIGVAASGVDRPYPAQHADLWQEVAAAGLLVSETPPGRPAQAWRFPARNRVIAALSDLVVVVESHATGGALLTADAAIERGVEVRAVPGPVGSPSSAGTNQLLCDGPGPVRDATDVLDALGTFRARPVTDRRGRRRPGAGQGRLALDRPQAAHREGGSPGAAGEWSGLGPDDGAVLAATGWQPSSLNSVVLASGLGPARVASALERLEAAGAVRHERGWWQRTGGAGDG